jgi:rubrerythrin
VSDAFAAELYVHAIAIEREAARRYAELAERLAQAEWPEAAALFRTFAEADARRLAALRLECAGLNLPELTADYTWRMNGPDALGAALRAENGARAFFEHAGRVAEDAAARALAKEMAAEEAEHAALLRRLAARSPA